MTDWQNRICGEGMESADQLLANPNNWRVHGEEQQRAMAGILTEVGWVQRAIVNQRTGHIVDGHLRALLAQRNGDAEVPVLYVDLSPEEERKVIAALDPIGALADTDQQMLDAVIDDLSVEDNDFQAFLDSLRSATEEEEEPDESEAARERLADLFLAPPFTVLDGRAGYWRDRKRDWLALGIESEVGRADDLTFSPSAQPPDAHDRKREIEARDGRSYTWGEYAQKYPEEIKLPGTSVFDPVVCELAYRWFCPRGGAVLDPFAGGSVRGVVAAMLGYAYTGVELRPEQVRANDANWRAIQGRHTASAPRASIPPLTVEEQDGIRVVRDDYVPGGSKRRVLTTLLAQHPAAEFVYATPAYGFAQVALAYSARDAGKRATLFTAERKTLHRRTQAAKRQGATVHTVKPGYLSTVQARAKEYADQAGAHLIKFGVDTEDFIEALADIARGLDEQPTEVWTVAGSGVFTRALQRAWPHAEHHAVQIGADPDVGHATLHRAPEAFEDPAEQPPPFDSCPEYDAKAWRFIQAHASPGALFWNVAGEAELPKIGAGDDEPEWIIGDSTQLATLLPDGYQADLVFSCPPYADLEVYSDDPEDISGMEWEQFLAAYREIIARACERLRDNRFAVWVVSEVRDKRGNYRGLVPETIRAFQDAGLAFYNEATLVTPTGSLAMRAGPAFRASRKLGRAHQNVLVFRKGDGQPEPVSIEALGQAAAEAFERDRQLIDPTSKVLVFLKGDGKTAAGEFGHPPLPEDIGEHLEDE